MYQNNRTKWPGRDMWPEYVVYFYESGLRQQYQQRQKNLLAGLYQGTGGYDFSSDLISKRSLPVSQSVEDVVRSGYLSIPRSEPETAIISDRKHTAWLGLDDIVRQIRQRYSVYQQNIYEIEVAKCATINSLYTHQAYHGPTTSKVEYSAKKRLDRLYQDQRNERSDLWRDISRIRLLLPEQAQSYLSAYRKVSILEDQRGDLA